ncbi:RidA family protein [Sphingomonas astaxanthinifaciens]|nr:RidA family protein [Sphingomonas astaxanthinifaciens]
MRQLAVLGCVAAMLGGAASAAPTRIGTPEAPIAGSVSVPPGSRIVYVSGTVPDILDEKAPVGAPGRYGDTEAQTRSILAKIDKALAAQGLGMGDVVMMRVFLVAPPGQPKMDFAGMMKAYRERFGTAAQPNKPARTTVQIAGLYDPDFLVEIEVTAAR